MRLINKELKDKKLIGILTNFDRQKKMRIWNGQKWALHRNEVNENSIYTEGTGIKDVNNREIFEGDIVVPTKFNDIPNLIEYVVDGFYRVKVHNGDKIYINPLGSCKLKIIGNIFENRELLNYLP